MRFYLLLYSLPLPEVVSGLTEYEIKAFLYRKGTRGGTDGTGGFRERIERMGSGLAVNRFRERIGTGGFRERIERMGERIERIGTGGFWERIERMEERIGTGGFRERIERIHRQYSPLATPNPL